MPPEVRPAPKREKKRCADWHAYHSAAKHENYPRSSVLPNLEKELLTIADGCQEHNGKILDRPWDSEALKTLRARRRSTASAEEKTKLSKNIWTLTGTQLRQYRTAEAEKKLVEFRNLEKLQIAHLCPIKKKHTLGPNLEACANLLKQVYTSDNPVQYSDICDVPLFSMDELEKRLQQMRKKRCANTNGIVLEMFLHGGKQHLDSLLICLN